MKKIMLLGSGELGKEVVIALQRLGQHVIAVDSYNDAPAQQVADEREVIDMTDGDKLDEIVAKHKPDIIVPEIEAIATDRFFKYEEQGIQVTPSAKAANFTMNRKKIRDLAAKELGHLTANYKYANDLEELKAAVKEIGMPCVVKPIMSSSGKGQSVIKTEEDIEKAWDIAGSKGRTGPGEIIIEEFVDFDYEITLLTVTQKNGTTLFCNPIGHRQERGDYQESWQPQPMDANLLEKAKEIAKSVTGALGGFGIWGCEFFIGKDKVYFSEVSPRPHDTGMVTLSNNQNFNQFELHSRAFLGYTIPEIVQNKNAVSAVILAPEDSNHDNPEYEGVDKAAEMKNSDLRIFGKPKTKPYRRMGVVVAYGDSETDIKELRAYAKQIADKVKVN